MNNTLSKRSHVFIKKNFQGRFILGVIALILLSGVCSALLIYLITSEDIQAQSLSAHAKLADIGARLGVSILLANVVAILVTGSVAVATVLYASHKIAGPLHRFEILCNEVGNGNLDTITQLRDKDQLQQLASSFSTMVAKLRDKRDRREKLIGDISSRIFDLKACNSLTPEHQKYLTELADTVAKLHQVDDNNLTVKVRN